MYRIEVVGVGCAPLDTLQANAKHAVSLGFAPVTKQEVHSRPLAVVGGGPSVRNHLAELKAWTGDIWAINGTCQWPKSQGIDATLFSVDPEECLAPLCEGVGRAILSSCCHPNAFAALAGADVSIFHTEHSGFADYLIGGSTSACRAPMLALRMGYAEVSYFGCEGDFGEHSHTYKNENHPGQLLIQAGGKTYRTTLQFMAQAQNLAEIISHFPDVFKDRSGGLLGAMLAHPDTWEVVALSTQLKQVLDPEPCLIG